MKALKLTAAAALALAVACGTSTGWKISGTIDGAPEGSRIAIEANNAGYWYVLDSATVDGKGNFSYTAAEPAPSADIMRVTLPGKGSIYFPVEGNDRITLESSAETFGTGHKLAGSNLAVTLTAIDSIASSADSFESIQRKLAGFVTSDTTGIIAFYTVGKSVGNKLIFDPNENFGNRIYGAAAQIYAHFKPLDPHGEALKSAYFAGRRNLGKMPQPEETVVEVPEAGLIEIKRHDYTGKMQSLQEVASKGKVVLLSFTGYSLQSSPAYNAILNDLYTLYHDKGLEIFQISFDADEVEWKEAARNLPWITVWNSPADGETALAAYNVGGLPTTFVIDRNGVLAERITDASALPKAVAKRI
ncbi:MAG: AhpC/TSA family protein [Muribaculaceae bacterium]|nr:AhpC/TSA family protein [Muribaculaceae bacterium]